jgi:hypothetical protein
MKIFIIFLFLPLTLMADPFILTDEELDPETEDILINKKEKYLRNESIIYNLNTEFNIKDQRHYTGADRNRFSFAGHVSGAYENLSQLLGAEVVYMRRSRSYNQLWWGLQFFQHKTRFDAVTQNQSSAPEIGQEGYYQRSGDEKNTITGLGFGVGYRFKLLLDFFETEDVFENIDVFINRLSFNESFIEKDYQGYGLTANYGLHKRSGTSFFYGGKLSYNIASVTRPPIEREKKTERSLSLGWTSLALELGFFF